MNETTDIDRPLRQTMAIVAALNLAYFGVEFAVAVSIDSVALFADSIDFLEDASLNCLALVALGWSARMRSRVGMVLAAILLAPGVATVATAYDKMLTEVVPAAGPLTITGLGALAINLTCAVLLLRFKSAGGALTKAVYLSARNDAAANVAIMIAGALTAATASHWPDLVVGVGIFLMNLDAAYEVYVEARKEDARSLRV